MFIIISSIKYNGQNPIINRDCSKHIHAHKHRMLGCSCTHCFQDAALAVLKF